MENFQNKFSSSKSKMLSLTVVVISLSVSTFATEPRKCFWCGPLAEQVHKSTRAPSCNELGIHVTGCDPGYTHCAVVATSPPYAESRLCVKLYQDECYSLYCNSTKIWRMTCPCLGDLCNGPNTQREKVAFSILTNLVKKSQYTRNKRTPISPSNFINNENKEIGNNAITIQLNTTMNKNNETVDKDNLHSNETNNENILDFKTPEKNTHIIKIEVKETIHETEGTENDDQNIITQKNMQNQPMDNVSSTVFTTQVIDAVKNEETSTIPPPHPNKELPSKEQQNATLNQKVTEATVSERLVNNATNTIQEKETLKSSTYKTELIANITPTISTEQDITAVKHGDSSSQELPNEVLKLNANHNEKSTEPTVTKIPDKITANTCTTHDIEIPESTTHKTQVLDNMTSTVSTKQLSTTSEHEESSKIHVTHPSKELATPEALQQNATKNITNNRTIHETKTPESTTSTIHFIDNIMSTVSTKQVSTTVKHESSSNIHLTHPSKELPTAEALQQNASLNDKITERPVTKPLEPLDKNAVNTHTDHEIKTPAPSTYKNNTATQINNCILTLVSGILLQRCL